jgi:hypothetical protein
MTDFGVLGLMFMAFVPVTAICVWLPVPGS